MTTEMNLPSAHIYMEAQIFAPDSKRLILHRSASSGADTYGGGSDSMWKFLSSIRSPDPAHRFLVCDLENGGELIPITSETGAIAPSVSPDGAFCYYFVDETSPGKGRLTLKRVRLDGTGREVVCALDSDVPGTRFHASNAYVYSTISSDGKWIAISCFLGDGKTESAPFGLLCFDVEKATIHLVLHGRNWCNMHAQYCRSKDPEASHDILIQEDHGCIVNASGILISEDDHILGGDIHVVRDDGTHFRDMPWGRDGNEFVQGHQCWRGRSRKAITSTVTKRPKEYQLVEGEAAPHADHIGIKTPGGRRNDLSRNFPSPYFCHFATDIAGHRLISDTGPGEGAIYVADLPESGDGPLERTRFLLYSRCSWKDVHIHPFLSPDGSMAFFNSDESGTLQAYMARGW